jgi:hypothetical protein
VLEQPLCRAFPVPYPYKYTINGGIVSQLWEKQDYYSQKQQFAKANNLFVKIRMGVYGAVPLTR